MAVVIVTLSVSALEVTAAVAVPRGPVAVAVAVV